MLNDLNTCMRVLCSRWKVLALGLLVGAGFGAGVSVLQTPKWEAVALVSPGSYVYSTYLARPLLVESNDNVLARLRSLDTARGVLTSLGLPYSSATLQELSSGTRMTNVGDMVELRVRNYSADQAVAFARAYVDELAKAELRFVEMSNAMVSKPIDVATTQSKTQEQKQEQDRPDLNGVALLGILLKGAISMKYVPPHFESGPTVLPSPVSPRPIMLVVMGALLGGAAALTWIFKAFNPRANEAPPCVRHQ